MEGPEAADLTIAAVERDTGIGKDTLRMWERRYGFPTPGRNEHGERTYPAPQVARLRLVKRLLDAGFRPARVVPLTLDALEGLTAGPADKSTPARVAVPGNDPQSYLATLRAHDLDTLRRRFGLAQLQLGLARFVTEVVSPLTTLIGDAWMRGEAEVFEEHAYTELVQGALRQALHGLPQRSPAARPRVLLATLRDEPHGLGLLMAETLLALDGASCVSLGVQMPVPDIVRAAQAFQCDIVALGCTGCNGPNAVLNGLTELRRQLPVALEVWAGGRVQVLQRRPPDGVRVVPSLDQIGAELRRWRAGVP